MKPRYGLSPAAKLDLLNKGATEDFVEIQYLATKFELYVVTKEEAERAPIPGAGQAPR